MKFRFFILFGFFLILYSLLGFNLYTLQIEKGESYLKKVQARNEFLADLELKRGQIFFLDRNQNDISVAINKNYPLLYAVPKEIQNPEQTAVLLVPLIGGEEKKLAAIFSDHQSLYRLLADKLSPDLINNLEKIGPLQGIYIDTQPYRFYPFQNLASQVLGFFGINDKNSKPTGIYGLEEFYNNVLSQEKNLYLTIDRSLQVQSENVLNGLIQKFDAVGGTIIIEEPKTGKILALTNKPDFDPNEYSSSSIKNFLNPAIHYLYEPGSVLKPLTMAAGIDLEVLTPTTTYVDAGRVTLNGKTIENWNHKAYGKITITEVIEQSVNTGAVFAEQKIGNSQFYNYLKKFGLDKITNIDLPKEAVGNLKNLSRKEARAIDFATASFGQGIAVTPMELISAFSAIANGGVLMRPFLNRDLNPQIVDRVIKPETSRLVIEMMESAVNKAQVAAIPGYRIAGKTGTAQIPDFQKGGYTEEYIHTYVGFAPISDPRFIVLVKLDKPNSNLAAQSVVPAFRDLAQFIFNYYNIPPDKL